MPPCIRHRSFAIAGARHGLPLLVLAPHRGLRCMGESLCMRLISGFLVTPTPLARDVADDGLPALVDGHVLDRDLLFASRPVALEGFHLDREGSGELVEGALGAVLLGDVVNMVEAAG